MARKSKEKHVTTLTGPQAEEMIKLWKENKGWWIEDKSVPGAAVAEIWTDN